MGSRRGRRPTGRRRLPLLGVVLAAGLPLGGCAPLAPTVTTPAASASAATWLDCDYGRCATVAVPLDPAYPGGRTVDLAVAMRPATQPRKGAIFVHPGGPGVSGRARLATIDRTGLEAYDLISWDPRGVGGSAPLTCLTGVAADAFVALDAAAPGVRADAVTTADAVWSTLRDASQQFSAACRDDDAALVDHLSAADQARDLETLRARLTGAPLRFLGVSEGARIGVAYARLYGANVAAMVLDAPVAATRPDASQAAGFDAALARWGWTARVQAVLDDTWRTPLAVGERTLTRPLAAAGIAALLYPGEDGREALGEALTAAESGDGAPLLAAADAWNGRSSAGDYDGLLGAFRATRCADSPIRTEEAALAAWRQEAAAAPLMGEALGPDLVCVGFPEPTTAVSGEASEVGVPVVVLASTGDPATPYAGARDLAADLPTGVLVTRDGDGHGAFRRGAACVDAAAIGALTAVDAGFAVEPQRC